MKWISKDPPLYVWKDDLWEREIDHKIFYPGIKSKFWFVPKEKDEVPFPEKTKVCFFGNSWYTIKKGE